MTTWIRPTSRRLALAIGLATTLIAPTLACMGDTTVDADEVVDPDQGTAAARVVGTWRMAPPDDELRELQVINAALSGKPNHKKRLKEMSKDEMDLFEMWAAKSGDEVTTMKEMLTFMKGCQFTFTDDQVTVKIGEDSFGPVDYDVVSADDDSMVLTFDSGRNFGLETHTIAWLGDDKGTDLISAADGNFPPLNMLRR